MYECSDSDILPKFYNFAQTVNISDKYFFSNNPLAFYTLNDKKVSE